MMGRRGMRGRFSFWIGPVAVSPLRMWGHRLWFGRNGEHRMNGTGGWALHLPWLRIQFGGPQPWRFPYTGPIIVRGVEPR